jgi:hypothetical protein
VETMGEAYRTLYARALAFPVPGTVHA